MSFKSFLRKIGDFFSGLFKSLGPIAKKGLDIGVRITDEIKKFDEEHPGAVDIITKLIPGDVDDRIAAKIREKLPEVMVQLRLVDATLGLTDPNEIVTAGIAVIKQLGGDYKVTFLNDLAIHLTRIASDGKVDIDDALYLAKWYYENKDVPEVDTQVDDANAESI